MSNLKMFCLTLEPNHYELIRKLGYEPVGLGDKAFNDDWYSDKLDKNISNKNKNYGEYTFHYWIWKNYLDKVSDNWIGFCQYRKFWSITEYKNEEMDFKKLSLNALREIPNELNKYETILGNPIYINQFKLMKFIKKGIKIFLKKPLLILDNKKRNINFHFDLMHGENNLNKAIDLLDEDNKEDFRKFVNAEVSFNPHNMFICRSKEKLIDYYEVLFSWLEKCEKLFGFENLKGYGQTRIYGFLAERFLSYWFQKNTKTTTIPIVFYDISRDQN